MQVGRGWETHYSVRVSLTMIEASIIHRALGGSKANDVVANFLHLLETELAVQGEKK